MTDSPDTAALQETQAEAQAPATVDTPAKPEKAKPAKFTAKFGANFERMLALIKKLIKSRSTNPITGFVRLWLDSGLLRIEATNLDMAFCAIAGSGEGHGSFLVSPELLDGAQSISVKGQKAEITGASTRETTGHDPEEFPLCFHAREFGYWARMFDNDELVHAFEACDDSTAREKGRYALNGVNLELHPHCIQLCGTDGRRLAYQGLEAVVTAMTDELRPFESQSAVHKWQTIVPSRLISLLKQFAKLPCPDPFTGTNAHAGDAVNAMISGLNLYVAENTIEFTRGDYRLRSLLVEGQFPDYRSVIPRDLDANAIFEREEMIAAMTEAAKGTSIESQAVRLEFDKTGLTWRTKSIAHGARSGKVKLQRGPLPACIGFDPQYILAGLATLKGRYVALEYLDKETGAILHDGDKDRRWYLVMPIDI